MPRFYFHLFGGTDSTRDELGVVLNDIGEAQRYAESAAKDILADKVQLDEALDNERIEVADEEGASVFSLPLNSVVRFR